MASRKESVKKVTGRLRLCDEYHPIIPERSRLARNSSSRHFAVLRSILQIAGSFYTLSSRGILSAQASSCMLVLRTSSCLNRKTQQWIQGIYPFPHRGGAEAADCSGFAPKMSNMIRLFAGNSIIPKRGYLHRGCSHSSPFLAGKVSLMREVYSKNVSLKQGAL